MKSPPQNLLFQVIYSVICWLFYTIKHLHAANLSVHLRIHATPISHSQTTIRHDNAAESPTKLVYFNVRPLSSSAVVLDCKIKQKHRFTPSGGNGIAEKDCVLIMTDKLNANFLKPFTKVYPTQVYTCWLFPWTSTFISRFITRGNR